MHCITHRLADICLVAHKIAWEEYGILHRDVSVGNILIYELEDGSPERKVIGLLTDWDLAKTKDQIFHPVASQSTRSVGFESPRYLSCFF